MRAERSIAHRPSAPAQRTSALPRSAGDLARSLLAALGGRRELERERAVLAVEERAGAAR